MAAKLKDLSLEKIRTTPELNKEATVEESPPYFSSPQVTTEPSDLLAANAQSVEKILTTPERNLSLTL